MLQKACSQFSIIVWKLSYFRLMPFNKSTLIHIVKTDIDYIISIFVSQVLSLQSTRPRSWFAVRTPASPWRMMKTRTPCPAARAPGKVTMATGRSASFLTLSPPNKLSSAKFLAIFKVLQSCRKFVKMLSECQTAWIWMRRRVTRRLIQIQAVCIWIYIWVAI